MKENEVTKLKIIRQAKGLSQSELANLAKVDIRSIQMYEQKRNDINKAQAETLLKLSKVLGCNIEDLMEDNLSF
ncbi:MAG: helix-turn-helix transcriptional regulator [Acholeplasmatales bacterium]|nr:helix-turn-helix transcriptional regulator [Acholeplasmatales bacterium]